MRIFGKDRNTLLYVLALFVLLFAHQTAFSQTCSGPTVHPTISISTSTSFICSGSNAKFVATSTNTGNNPSYQWKVNGINAGNNSDTFWTSTLHNGDVVNCVVTADPAFPCALPNKATSYGIAMNVSASVAPVIQIEASANDICPGTLIRFTAIAQNANSSAFFQWKLNGVDVGADTAAYADSSLKNGDDILCVLTDSASCYNKPVQSNTIVLTVKTLPEVTVTPLDTFVAPGSMVKLQALVENNDFSAYEWLPAGNFSNINSLTATTQPVFGNSNYDFNLITGNGCVINKEVTVYVLNNLSMPNAFTPNNDGNNDVFRIPAHANIRLEEFSVYDRWGNKLFTTGDAGKGWDGVFHGKKQEAGLYIYIIRGSNSTGKILSRGSFVLVR